MVHSIEARSSHKSRTIESGNNFLKGLVSDEEPLPPMPVDRNITRYFDYCAKFDLEVRWGEKLIQSAEHIISDIFRLRKMRM